MIPVTQTKVIIQNSEGVMISRGNCFAACIASLLELPIHEVPNVEVLFDDTPFWYEVTEVFLASKGLTLVSDDRFKCFHPDLCKQSEEWISVTSRELKDLYYLVSGTSIRGFQHMTIWQNGKLAWDPYPTREGLVELHNFQVLDKV